MAGVKITDLEVLLEAASDDLLYIVDVSDTTESPQGTSKKIEVSYLRPYKVYSALLTQVDTDPPTAIVLENTIGNIVWSYIEVGNYKGTLSSAFTTNKTFVFINSLQSYDVNTAGVTTYNVNEVNVTTGVPDGGTPTNGILINTPIEIRVYN